MYLVPYRPQPRITHRHVPPHCVGGTIAPLSVFVGGSTIAPLSVCLWEEQTLSVCRCDVSVTVQCVCAHATTVTRVTTHHTTGLLLLRVVCDTSPLSLHYTPGIPTLASSRSNVEAIHQHDAPQIAQGEVARAGCSSAAVPPACLARGTSCPVYFQGVVMRPGCLSGAGILLHNKLTGPCSTRYTLIW